MLAGMLEVISEQGVRRADGRADGREGSHAARCPLACALPPPLRRWAAGWRPLLWLRARYAEGLEGVGLARRSVGSAARGTPASEEGMADGVTAAVERAGSAGRLGVGATGTAQALP